MIYVDSVRCTGCGDCLEACPQGAISMQKAGVAFIEESLCQACEACLAVCPEGAILSVEAVEAPSWRPVEAPSALVPAGSLQRETGLAPPTLRELTKPALGAALLWTGRELLPRVAGLFLDLLDRRSQSAQRRALGLDPTSRQPLASSNRMPLRQNPDRGAEGRFGGQGRGGRGRRRERRRQGRRG